MFQKPIAKGLLWAGLIITPVASLAQEIDGADTAWIMTSTALVLFMTIPGLSLFYAGLVRVRNVLSVLMQCFSITCVASLVWLILGYSLAFSEGNGFIGGFGNVLFANIAEDTVSGTIPESLFALFQMTFAVITPALIFGGFAERVKFSGVMLFSVLWLVMVYAPVTHWVWAEGGWLFERGLLDFAGGTVVHITAGIASLVCALVIGPRSGFGKTPMPPHNMTMTVTGAGMLWVGWFGFNGGSALASDGNASMAMLVTHISAAAGSLSWILMEKIKYGKASVLGVVTGMVAGLGTITPASGFVGPGGALIIGLTAGMVCFFATGLVKNYFRIDDSLDVFPVHGVGGMLGTFLAGIFASAGLGVLSGQGYAEGVTMSSQLVVQLTGIVATIVYTAVLTWIVLKIVNAITGMRVTEEDESVGLDIVLHDERGYDM
ncbi:MAG: ammonium transporter [Gammaproteobacteria bacterium]|jgi:Amt family ammonium transporter|nr:ammonium transporter [Gammaproteobacteria bacterium]MBT6042961.1 ammonium transporter [Gammaproteobacteria bacterium]